MLERRPHLLVDARPVDHPTAGGRGIGNYTLGLLEGLRAVGASFTALIDRPGATAGLAGVVPPESIALFRPGVTDHRAHGAGWFIATGLFLHPISFDPIPRVVTECALPVAGVMYDVIPYRFPERYQREETARRQATLRAPLARSVDLTVAISRFAAETAIDELDLDARTVRVIGGGVGSRFVPARRQLRPSRPTVVAVTGPDPRKNTGRLLQAWALLPAQLRERHQLVIVSGGPTALLDSWRDIVRMEGCSDSVRFTGAVSDEDVVELLQQAALVVQPSLEEGFGLPVVEAAACAAAVICSNVSALPEVLDEPDATFDPYDPPSIARAIERGLVDTSHRDVLLAAGRRAAARWRWDRVASDLLAAIREHQRVPWPMGRAVSRIAVVGRPVSPCVEDDPDNDVVEAVRRVATGEVLAFIDTRLTSARVVAGREGLTWPAAAFGRYVKCHDVDDVVTIVDGRQGQAVAARIARADPTHVWVRGDPVGSEVLAGARSVIVATAAEAAAIAGLAGEGPPVLLLAAVTDGWGVDDIAGALVTWLATGHRAGVPVTVAGPADTTV